MIGSIGGFSPIYQYGKDSRVQSELGQKSQSDVQDKHSKMKFLSETGRTNMQRKSIVEESLAYRDSLSAQRDKRKATSSELKQLRYNFKDIGGQIRRSKTSNSAKQVASAARREVARLKRMKQSEQYDEDELRAAISHAQSMERVAKRKAKHLLEEEMVKVKDAYGTEAELDEREDEITSPGEKTSDEQAMFSDEYEYTSEELALMMSEQSGEVMSDVPRLEELTQSLNDMMADIVDDIAQMPEEMMELMEDMAEAMEELPEELNELLEDAQPVTSKEMDREEFRTLKQKHRAKEEKELVKADTDYLKALFDHYQKQLASNAAGAGTVPSAPASTPAIMQGGSIIATPVGFDFSI